VDKLTLAALEATLTGPPTPVAVALAASAEKLRERAEGLCQELADAVAAEPVASTAVVGGGGAPGVMLPSAAVRLPSPLAAELRTGEPPVVGHVEHGGLLLDLIAVPPEDDSALLDAVRRAAKALPD
jgi:L-seryl-tRNA(Ser) seleniumtransferase